MAVDGALPLLLSSEHGEVESPGVEEDRREEILGMQSPAVEVTAVMWSGTPG
uniref:Uncharacterized protein n=1 Tax=Arundo donax TaxID=35708 RepID=A0A0A9FMS2_ARUDO